MGSYLFKRKTPLRKGYEVLVSLRVFRDRVNRIQGRIEERISELSKRLIDLQSRGDTYLARRYAEEIARLKNLAERLSALATILDKVDFAVQRAIMMDEFRELSTELLELLRDMSKLPEIRLPEVSVLFADLEHGVRELVEVTRSSYIDPVKYDIHTDSDVKAVLEEAKDILRKKLEPVS